MKPCGLGSIEMWSINNLDTLSGQRLTLKYSKFNEVDCYCLLFQHCVFTRLHGRKVVRFLARFFWNVSIEFYMQLRGKEINSFENCEYLITNPCAKFVIRKFNVTTAGEYDQIWIFVCELIAPNLFSSQFKTKNL